MKILFINISDIKGGAAIATYRLGKALEKMGTENLFLVRSKYSDDENVIETKGNRIINFVFNLIGLQYKFLPSSRLIIKYAKKFKPDIISVNQIEGGYFQTRDLIKLGKIAPVFWTMHDEWGFNNNAHTTPGKRTTYPQIGIKWGDWLKKQKWIIYQKADFEVICPSQWLFDKKIYSICDKPGHIIPNRVDKKFTPGKVTSVLQQSLAERAPCQPD